MEGCDTLLICCIEFGSVVEFVGALWAIFLSIVIFASGPVLERSPRYNSFDCRIKSIEYRIFLSRAMRSS